MNISQQQLNITRIKAVHNALGDIRNDVVFVGGATVSLYADRSASDVRPTDDVDILVEITTQKDFGKLEERLRERGFKNDTTAKFVGRYLLPGIVVDVMPTETKILGFGNKWYREGFAKAIPFTIDELNTVQILPSSYFVACKIEAFNSRGKKDPMGSRDLEDLVFVLENRSAIWQEMISTSGELNEYLKKQFTNFYKNPYISEWIDAFGSFYSPPTSYFVLGRMKEYLSKVQ